MRSLKEERLGQEKEMSNGNVCKIIEYYGANNITVEFESGKIVKNKSYQNFIKGSIKEVSNKEHSAVRVGETRMMNCGMNATVIKYVDSTNIDVQFEDGYISTNKYYKKFLDGGIHNKNIEYKNFIDLTGQKFGRWTVLYKDTDRIVEKHNKNKSNGISTSIIYWICECECGNKRSVERSNLKLGVSRSCGCLEREMTSKRNSEKPSLLGKLKDTHPELIDLLENKMDGDINIGSSRKIKTKCPICGNIRVYNVDYLAKGGFNCLSCSPKISYPNRFVYKFLRQVGVEFETEKSFLWICRRKYDFYVPSYNMIIEAHGLQHYSDCSWGKASEQMENDVYKEAMAIKNGIDKYIQLDCRFSNFDYIKKSIETSELSKTFNLDKVEWKEIERELCINI